ncbi:NAD(P)H dehydrogenase (quinone) [Streptosporangium album]|uniref:NAD(P)H dehydrogenase (Quinone) n=1 Tax=Streptosporangium album TaxID=47479 RepID=A0A7W7RWT0_9ACTN|nr:NAD(P)H-binding protein [Streptosporangium album]MBB4939666.1 NAD(P)H dehydrogenase (quinone) [Streptosporangium album]
MILITGATGALGGLVAARLSGRDDVVLGTRDPRQAPGGLPVRRVDFDDPDSLSDGFAGVDTLLLVSAGYGEDDVVVARHGAAIEAAEKAGIGHIVYTSLSAAGDHLTYALAHRWTERRLREGDATWTVLRNGLYAELLATLTPVVDGRVTAPLGQGRLAAVAREDLADVAARVVVDARAHAGRTYELVGEEAVGGADLARALTAATGSAVSYEPGTLAEARAAFAVSGLEPLQVPMLVTTYSSIANGFMAETESDLRALLGRAPRSALTVVTGSASR